MKRSMRSSNTRKNIYADSCRSIAPPENAAGPATERAALRFITAPAVPAAMKKLLLAIICTGLACWTFAQDTSGVAAGPEPTGLRAYEKVYVVVAVLTTILAGFFIYVIRLDRKISRLEKE